MPVENFIDTNILLYAYDLDSPPEKRKVAGSLIQDAWQRRGSTALSVQVLLEFYVNFVRKNPTGASDASAITLELTLWPVIENTTSLFQLGLIIKDRWKVSIWDAMILAAAQTSGAGKLFTEDLNHGQDYGGVRVINPFL
jgi:predicted nucleic acid-binding protein